MNLKDRLKQIETIIRRDKEVAVSELSSQLGVTPETIRRDLEKLEAEQLLIRTYGGAVLREEDSYQKINFLDREKTNIEEKKVIAELAAREVNINASIGCDASSTALEFMKTVKNRSDILVLTNSVQAICQLENLQFRLLSTGGYVNLLSYSMQGSSARNMMNEYHLDAVFISCKGIGPNGSIFDSHELESEMKKAMLERGNKIYLLADHTKFGGVGFTKLASLKQVDAVITDRKPSDAWLKLFKQNGTEILYPELYFGGPAMKETERIIGKADHSLPALDNGK